MTYDELIIHWNHLCSLAGRLENTEKYVYHGLKEMDTYPGKALMEHGKVYSDEFREIILLASSEFEVIGKIISKKLGCKPGKNEKEDIRFISKSILSKYPKIVETMVYTKYAFHMPLADWKIKQVSGGVQVQGLEWWLAYTNLKHNEAESFKEASLENAINAVLSLYVLDLYLMKIVANSLNIANDYPAPYMRSLYKPNYYVTAEGQLPDFGNKSTAEVIKEQNEKLHSISEGFDRIEMKHIKG